MDGRLDMTYSPYSGMTCTMDGMNIWGNIYLGNIWVGIKRFVAGTKQKMEL